MSFGVAMKAVRSLGKLHTIFRQMWYTWGFATSCFGGQLGLCTSAAGLGGDSQEFQSVVPAIEGQNSWTKAGRCSEVVGVSVNDGAPTGCLKWVRFCSYLRLLSGIDLIWISDYKWRSAGVWNLSWHCQKIASQYRANGQAVFIISLGPAVLFWVYFNKPLGQLDVWILLLSVDNRGCFDHVASPSERSRVWLGWLHEVKTAQAWAFVSVPWRILLWLKLWNLKLWTPYATSSEVPVWIPERQARITKGRNMTWRTHLCTDRGESFRIFSNVHASAGRSGFEAAIPDWPGKICGVLGATNRFNHITWAAKVQQN